MNINKYCRTIPSAFASRLSRRTTVSKRKIAVLLLTLIVCGTTGFIYHSHGQQAIAAEAAETTRRSVIAVKIVMPVEEEWPRLIQTSGAIAAWHEAIIGAEIGGFRIVDVLADVGDKVTKGQVLARLETDSTQAELLKQRALVAQAKANMKQARANAERARKVKGSGALSELQIEEYLITEETAAASLASAEADLDNTKITLEKSEIRASDDGVITSRSATLGAVVSSGTEMFRLLRQNRIEWNAEVDSQQLAQIKPKQKAVVTLPGGIKVEGRVRIAAPVLNASTGRAIVYVTLPEQAAAAGSFANGEIELKSATALVLPQSAVVLRDGRSYVFTLNADNKVSRRAVTTGRNRDNMVEILTALDKGLRVVESGGAFLSEGSLVTIAQ